VLSAAVASYFGGSRPKRRLAALKDGNLSWQEKFELHPPTLNPTESEEALILHQGQETLKKIKP